MISRPEYTGEYPFSIGGGDVVFCKPPGAFGANYYVVNYSDGENWDVDCLSINEGEGTFRRIINGYKVWKGCVKKLPRKERAELTELPSRYLN